MFPQHLLSHRGSCKLSVRVGRRREEIQPLAFFSGVNHRQPRPSTPPPVKTHTRRLSQGHDRTVPELCRRRRGFPQQEAAGSARIGFAFPPRLAPAVAAKGPLTRERRRVCETVCARPSGAAISFFLQENEARLCQCWCRRPPAPRVRSPRCGLALKLFLRRGSFAVKTARHSSWDLPLAFIYRIDHGGRVDVNGTLRLEHHVMEALPLTRR